MSDFEIVSKDAEIDLCYGLYDFCLTKDEISALMCGKKLYSTVNCSEYAITIELAESEDTKKMNKQEVLAEMAELKERLNKLEKMYASLTSPYKRWRAEKDDAYYFISTGGKINYDTENVVDLDDLRYAIGNYFETEGEAEFEVERLKVIAELREWTTPISEFDWNNNNKKYILEVRTIGEKCSLAIDYDYVYQLSDLYFKTKEQAENAIKAVGEDRIIKYYFRR